MGATNCDSILQTASIDILKLKKSGPTYSFLTTDNNSNPLYVKFIATTTTNPLFANGSLSP